MKKKHGEKRKVRGGKKRTGLSSSQITGVKQKGESQEIACREREEEENPHEFLFGRYSALWGKKGGRKEGGGKERKRKKKKVSLAVLSSTLYIVRGGGEGGKGGKKGRNQSKGWRGGKKKRGFSSFSRPWAGEVEKGTVQPRKGKIPRSFGRFFPSWEGEEKKTKEGNGRGGLAGREGERGNSRTRYPLRSCRKRKQKGRRGEV